MGKIGRFHPFIPYIVLLHTQKTPYIVIYPFVTALKSLGRNTVPVQARSAAPSLNRLNFFFFRKMFGLFCFIEEFESFNG